MSPFLMVGDPVPHFAARNAANPRFHMDVLGGRWVMLLLPGALSEPAKAAGLAGTLAGGAACLHPARAVLVVLATQAASATDHIAASATDDTAASATDDAAAAVLADGYAKRVLWDDDGAALKALRATRPDGTQWEGWVLLDPTLRVFATWPLAEGAAAMTTLAALPPPEAHAGAPLSAPALIVPRVLEPELCRNLIAFHEADGGGESGFMRDVDGKTVGLLDPSVKRRRDAFIENAGLQAVLRDRLATRLLPEIRRAFHFRVTRIERYVVSCYDAADQGFFAAHRDNTTLATAHRRFAVTINLNTGEYEGGELCFPEYGTRTYVAPPGGAVVFSCSLLHEARPVTRGRRYACLPFLYDEEGERQRLASLHLLGANNAFVAAPSAA